MFSNNYTANNVPVAPIGFESLIAEVNTNQFNIAPVIDNSNYSNYHTQTNVPNNYDNTSINNVNYHNNDNQINTIGLPLQMKEAFNDLIRNNRCENFSSSQDYDSIRRSYSDSNRFVDNQFRSINESVFFTHKYESYLRACGKFPYRSDQIEWRRAKDLYPRNAHFVLNKRNQFADLKYLNESNYKDFFHTTDLDQGSLGNCWFISAATGIIQNYTLFKRVVPFDNSFEDGEYCGAFHFRFWIYGSWKDVVIDDYLPIGPDNKLIFSKNRESPNEFWCALLEKAYAKVCGSYEALDGGFTSDALIDMSGGIEEVFNLVEIRKTMSGWAASKDKLDYNLFWDVLINARKHQSVIGSNIELLNSDTEAEVKLPNGLVRGHAYICTRLAELGNNQRIMRLYNPWGNEVEWNGSWSDNSSIWRSISRDVKEKLELKIEKDGEFWMSYEDWLLNFDFCQICNLTPNINSDISPSLANDSRFISNIFSMWQCQIFHGQWIYGESAGGRGEPNHSKFYTNPQIAFYINQKDVVKNNSCWVIIGLMQKYTRQKRVALQLQSGEEYIQFRLFKVRDNDTYFRYVQNGNKIDSRHLERVGSSGAYINKREVTARFQLTPGAYIVVPSIYEDNTEGEFIVRIFTEMPLSQRIDITNDIRNLSIGGGSNILDQFAQATSDFIRFSRPKLDDMIGSTSGNCSIGRKRSKHDKPQISCNQM